MADSEATLGAAESSFSRPLRERAASYVLGEPEIQDPLLTIPVMTKKGDDVNFLADERVLVVHDADVLLRGQREGNLFRMKLI